MAREPSAAPPNSRAAPWLVAASAAAVVAALTQTVGPGAALEPIDQAVAQWIGQQGTPTLERIMAVVSVLHRPRGIVWATVLASAVMLWRRDRVGALMLSATVLGGASLNHLLKHTVMRPRPGYSADWSALTDYSFPSGHAANATLLYGTLAALVLCSAASRIWKAASLLGAASLVGLVGFSRLVLGAHHISDVLAGAALGVGCIAVCVGLVALRSGADGRALP